MHNTLDRLLSSRSGRQPNRFILLTIGAVLLCGLESGCASISNPVANGVPVRRVPPELLGESKENLENVPLSLLRQPGPVPYKLAAEDTLGIWIEGILGDRDKPPPLHFAEGTSLPPVLGYPVRVEDDGTILLPYIKPLVVKGMTLGEVQEAVRKAYTVDNKILLPGRERIIVSLQRPRQYHILVIRQDTGGPNPGSAGGTGFQTGSTGFILPTGNTGRVARRSSGFALELPAYQNDVLNALTRTGGFPGTDVADEIIIERGAFAGDQGRDVLVDALKAGNASAGRQRFRIPLRYRPGEMPKIKPEEIILNSGDIVYVESRPQDVFYTTGILPPGERILPRDTDLDVIRAITQCGGSLDSGGLNTVNISGTLLGTGIGSPSPSLCSIIRTTPGGQQLNIVVDLNKAQRDATERILIQPNDVLVLQQTPEEALAGYLVQVFHLNFSYIITSTSRALSTFTGAQTQ